MRSYEAARSLFSFLAFCAWSVVVIGVLVALIGAGGGSRYGGAGAGLLAMVPGMGISIAGLLLLAFVQMGRAGVDTAEYTQQMLKISRDQLEVSQQAIKSTRQQFQSFAQLNVENKTISSNGAKGFGSSKDSETPGAKSDAVKVHESGMIEGDTIEYSGHKITFSQGKFLAGGSKFQSIGLAEDYINRTYRNQGLLQKRS